MFTGIIQATGKIKALHRKGDDMRIQLDTGALDLSETQIGDSIAVNGVCLTVIELNKSGFMADVSNETLSCSTLASASIGMTVNLEKALTLGTPLGGHLVSGHVDGIGKLLARWEDGRSVRFRFEAPANISQYIAAKGSITVDGISLTVNKVDGNRFELNIVPHTLSVTTMGQFEVGAQVNLEVDVIARYVERLISQRRDDMPVSGGISEAFLAQHGFLRGGKF